MYGGHTHAGVALIISTPYNPCHPIDGMAMTNPKAGIESLIQRKLAERARLEVQIRELSAFIDGLRASLPFVSNTHATKGVQEHPSQKPSIRPGSKTAKAFEAIERAGRPLYIDDILELIGEPKEPKPRLSLVGSLSRYVGQGELFIRTAPNTFGLKGMDSSEEEEGALG
jgi:hypothetical protein